MEIYIISGSDLEIYLMDKAECLSKLEELNAPYYEWTKEEEKRLERMAPFEEECRANWKELRRISDGMQTDDALKNTRIEDSIRHKFANQGKPWYLEMHSEYEQQLPCPKYYYMTERTVGVTYPLNSPDDYDYEPVEY
jgi:hypothetical protein